MSDPFAQPDPFDTLFSGFDTPSAASSPSFSLGDTDPNRPQMAFVSEHADPFDSLFGNLEEQRAILEARKKRLAELKLAQRQEKDYEALQTHGILGPLAAGMVGLSATAKEVEARRMAASGDLSFLKPEAVTPEAQQIAEANLRGSDELLAGAAESRATAAGLMPENPNFFQRQAEALPGMVAGMAATAVNPAAGAAVWGAQSAAPAFAEERARGVAPGEAVQASEIPGTVGALLAFPGMKILGKAAGPVKQDMLPGFLKHTIRSAAEMGSMGTAIEAANIAAEAKTGKDFTWEEIRSRLGASTLEMGGAGVLFGALGARKAVRAGNERFKKLEDFVDSLNRGVAQDEALLYGKLKAQRGEAEADVFGRAARASRLAESRAADQAMGRLDQLARESGAEPPSPLSRLEVIKQELGITERTPVERLRDESLAILERAGRKIGNEDPLIVVDRMAARLGIPDVSIDRRIELLKQELGLAPKPEQGLIRAPEEATLAPDATRPAEPAAEPAAGPPDVGRVPGPVLPEAGRGAPADRPLGRALPVEGLEVPDAVRYNGEGVPLPDPAQPFWRGQSVGDRLEITKERRGFVPGINVSQERGIAEDYAQQRHEGEGPKEVAQLGADIRNPFSFSHSYDVERLRQIEPGAVDVALERGEGKDGRLGGSVFLSAMRESFLRSNPAESFAGPEEANYAALAAISRRLQSAGYDSTYESHSVYEGPAGAQTHRRAHAWSSLIEGRVWRETAAGKETRAVTAGFDAGVPLRYRLREADSLVTSHDDLGRVNPDYPERRQPRDRTREQSEAQVEEIATRPNPLLLGEHPEARGGAPIVGADRVVDSGNGRTMGLRRMYARNPEGTAAYKQWLKENAAQFGIDPADVDRMRKPVLVREYTGEMAPEARDAFAGSANVRGELAYSRTEQALSDAGRITPAMLDALDPANAGDVSAAGNREFVRSFIASLPQAERGALSDRDGNLSQDGVRRVQAAIFAKAYGDPQLLERTLEAPDENTRRIGNGMLAVAPMWARMRSLVEAGALHPADATEAITAALQKLGELRREKVSAETYLAQQPMFGAELTPEAQTALKWLSGEISRSQQRSSLFLIRYVELLEADGSPAQEGLFGPKEPPSIVDLLNRAGETYKQARGGTEDMFSGLEGEVKLAPEPKAAAETAPEEGPRPKLAAPQAAPEGEAPVETANRVSVEELVQGELGAAPEGMKKKDARLFFGKVVSDARFKLFKEDGVWYGEWVKDPTAPEDTLHVMNVAFEVKGNEGEGAAKRRLVTMLADGYAKKEPLKPAAGKAVPVHFAATQGPRAAWAGPMGPQAGQTKTGRFSLAMPELVELAQTVLRGDLPQVKRVLGRALGLYVGGEHKIKLLAGIFKDPKQAAATLAHEIGHAIDALPDKMIHQRGNILGRIAVLHKYLKDMMPAVQGGPENWITDKERAKAMRRIEKEVLGKGRPNKKAKRYNEWMGERKAQEPEIRRRFEEWLAGEAEARGMVDANTITKELHAVSAAWRPDLWAINNDERIRAYRESSVELFADSFSMLLNDPDRLAQMAPTFHRTIMEYLFAPSRGPLNEPAGQLNRKAEAAAIYDELTGRAQQGMEAIQAHRARRVQDMIAEGTAKLARGLVSKEKPQTSVRDEAMQNFVDAAHFLYKGANLARKKMGKGSSLYRYGQEAIRRFEEWTLNNSASFAMVSEIGDRVLRPLHEHGVSTEELQSLLFFRRVSSTEGTKANPLGFDAQSAAEQIDAMRSRLGPQKFAVVEAAADAYWTEIREPLLRDLEGARVLKPEFMDRLLDNRHYTRFAVLRYLSSHPVLSAATGFDSLKTRIGTFNKIADPLTATVLADIALRKLVDRTRAVRAAAEFAMMTGEAQRAPKVFRERYMTPKEPPRDSGKRLVTWMQDGKVEGAWLPEAYAKMFDRSADQGRALEYINKWGMRWLRASFVTHNPMFTVWNIQRDLRAFLKYAPSGRIGSGTSIVRAKALYTSYRDVSKRVGRELMYAWADVLNPKMRDEIRLLADELEMLKSRAIYAPGRAVWESHHLGPEAAFEMLQERIGVSDGAYREMVRKPWARFFHALGKTLSSTNEITERAMKLAGWRYLKEAFPKMSDAEVAQLVRNRIGTPNTQRRGLKYNLYNNLWMFSNVAKEGWRQTWESARENPTAFVFKTMMYDFGTAAFAAAASRGALNWLLGDRADEWWGAVDDNDKALYTIVPLGWTQDDKPVYLRFPHDHFGQFFHAVAWKSLGATANTSDLLSLAVAQVPWGPGSLNPLVDSARYIAQYAEGINPRDAFRGREILREAEFRAGGWEAWSKVLSASANEFSPYRFPTSDYEGVVGHLEEQLAMPVWGNLLRRFVKVSDYGRYQQARAITGPIAQEEARTQLDRDRGIIDVLKKDPKAGARTVWNTLQARGIQTHARYGDFVNRVEEIRMRLYGSNRERLISSGRSKKQKEAIEQWLAR